MAPPLLLRIQITDSERTSALLYPASDDGRMNVTLILAHGAGAGQNSAFMVQFATGLSAAGLDVLTFNFLYTEQRRRTPDRTEKLEACYRGVIATAKSHEGINNHRLFIGGKSMGGRIATHLAASPDADALKLKGVVLLGYPLHPPGKPDRLRAAHLPAIRVPVLIVQGSRDAFGTPDELRPVVGKMRSSVTLHVIEGADHSLAPPKTGSPPVEQVHRAIQRTIVEWIADQ